MIGKRIFKILKTSFFIGGAIVAALYGYNEGTLFVERLVPRVLKKMKLVRESAPFNPMDFVNRDDDDDEDDDDDWGKTW